MNIQPICENFKHVTKPRSNAKNFYSQSSKNSLQATCFAYQKNRVKQRLVTSRVVYHQFFYILIKKIIQLYVIKNTLLEEIKTHFSFFDKRSFCRDFRESEMLCSESSLSWVSNSMLTKTVESNNHFLMKKKCSWKTWKMPEFFFGKAFCLTKVQQYNATRDNPHKTILQGKKAPTINSSSLLTACPTEQEQSSRTIVVTSGKGGVGKTTTTANLGMCIARLGYRVALVDADIGLRNLDLLLGLENRVLYTAMDIFEGECRLDQALIRDKRLKNLCLLAISKNRHRYNVTRQKMDQLVSSLSSLGYHYILIDCPAGIDVGFINAISPAQEAIVVTTPEITAMRDADRVAGILEANGIYNSKLLINRVRPDMIQRHDMMSVQDVQEVLGIPLLGAIPEDINVIISTNRGEPLVLRKKLTLSGIAFENAARRLMGKQDYLIDLQTPYKNIFQKIQAFVFRSDIKSNTG